MSVDVQFLAAKAEIHKDVFAYLARLDCNNYDRYTRNIQAMLFLQLEPTVSELEKYAYELLTSILDNNYLLGLFSYTKLRKVLDRDQSKTIIKIIKKARKRETEFWQFLKTVEFLREPIMKFFEERESAQVVQKELNIADFLFGIVLIAKKKERKKFYNTDFNQFTATLTDRLVDHVADKIVFYSQAQYDYFRTMFESDLANTLKSANSRV